MTEKEKRKECNKKKETLFKRYLIFYELTMDLVMIRPKAVKRKLVIEKTLVSKGKYQDTGESTARSFSHTIFQKEEFYFYIRWETGN